MRTAIPFIPVVRPGAESSSAAKQLTELIQHNEAAGWRYVRLESVTTVRSNGCIASLMGNPTSTIVVQVAVFEHD